jgi:hypothetical protein
MRALTASELLTVWETGSPLSAPRRALLLLSTAVPDLSRDSLGQLSVGQRDDLLLQLRAAAFGPQLEATCRCPNCGEQLEMLLNTGELRSTAQHPTGELLTLDCANHSLTFRPPNAFDLVEISTMPDLSRAEAALLRRCVHTARIGDHTLSPDELPAPVLAALSERLAEIDPAADLRFSLNCPACQHGWEETFDIVSFFWREIEAWSARLLREVHTLARSYGWSESEIVALSPARRRLYLEMASS